jgi:hypothetical protein
MQIIIKQEPVEPERAPKRRARKQVCSDEDWQPPNELPTDDEWMADDEDWANMLMEVPEPPVEVKKVKKRGPKKKVRGRGRGRGKK